MSAYTVISGVTKTLASFLNTATGVSVEFDKSPAANISDAAPLIHLYLYRVEQNPFFTNNDWSAPSPTVLQEPPIGLNLFYLITPYGNGELQIQMTLGEIIKVFHEDPIIPPSAFDPSLADTTEELRVVQHPLPLDHMTDFWRSFAQKSYRLSITYQVSAVLIDSAVTRTVRRVAERHLEVRTSR